MGILDQFNLKGKTALVTGCNKGIGKGMALGLAEAGADIIGVSASLELSGSKIEKEVTALGRKFKAYQADFSNRESLYAFIKKAQAENPKIDILINNAGTIKRAPAAEHPDEYWDEVIKINLDSQFILAREFGGTNVATGKRQDHLHLFPAYLSGRNKCDQLCQQQRRIGQPGKRIVQ